MALLLLLFDVTNRNTFDELHDFRAHLQLAGSESVTVDGRRRPVIIVIGTKIDLANAAECAAANQAADAADNGNSGASATEPGSRRREVAREEAERVAFGELDADAYVEVSAKTGEGVEYLRRVIRRCAPQPRSRVGAVKLPAASCPM
jgi:50S ribosomal subunit-associated GTPase HflX